MSTSHGMGIKFKRESNNGNRKPHIRMLVNDSKYRYNGGFSMKACLVLAVIVLIISKTNLSQAMPRVNAKNAMNGPVVRQSRAAIIAFPRVGRSVSDDEYSTLEMAQPYPGEQPKRHTRANEATSMIAFPRVGRSPHTNDIMKLLADQSRYYGKGQWSLAQDFKESIENNDLYQFLHSVLREIARNQQQNAK